MAENEELMKLEAPSARTVICMLLAIYYTFNRSYPKVSKSLFDFLDRMLFGRNNRNISRPFTSFLNKYEDDEACPY
jgi:hypothetical protein